MIAPKIAAQVEIDAKYAVYLERQAADIAGFRRDEALRIPDALDYRVIAGLSAELRDKLIAIRPQTVGQAGRIEGITPAALTLLAAHAKRRPAGAMRLASDRDAALALFPLPPEIVRRLDIYCRSAAQMAENDQSRRQFDPAAALDPAYRGFAASFGRSTRGAYLGGPRLGRRLSRPCHRDPLGGDAGRAGASDRIGSAQMRFPARCFT